MISEVLAASTKFKQWKASIEASGLEIHNIEEKYSRIWHGDQVLFSVVMLDATTPEGKKIPPICFLKGRVSCVMVVLIDEATGDRYNLLVKQRRICNGDFIYEQVAGLVDEGEEPHAVAVREVEEETGITVTPEQVIPLNSDPIYPATGTSDESMYFFYVELTMSKEKIMSYDQNETGIAAEHEQIFTQVTTLPEAYRLIKNTNGLHNMTLYFQHKGEWQLPS